MTFKGSSEFFFFNAILLNFEFIGLKKYTFKSLYGHLEKNLMMLSSNNKLYSEADLQCGCFSQKKNLNFQSPNKQKFET